MAKGLGTVCIIIGVVCFLWNPVAAAGCLIVGAALVILGIADGD